MISAIRLTGVEAPLVIEGAMDSLVFRGYIERLLAPTLHAGDIVVMDNLNSHKAVGVRQAIEAVDALLYQVLYECAVSCLFRTATVGERNANR